MLPVVPPDPRAYAILAEAGFGDDLFNPRQHRACELVEQYALHLALDLVGRLGVDEVLAERRSVDEVLAARGFVADFRPALRWLLERLAVAGLLGREDDRYAMTTPLPPAQLDAARTEILATDPAYAPALALLDEAAALYPRVARGETNGERALFLRASLWVAYFDNRNVYYALNNRVAARAAANRLPAAGGTVLEVGAGLGSATEALLDLLAERPPLAAYHFTEPVAFFRRRAERKLTVQAGTPFHFAALDLNQSWTEQGFAPGSADVVWGVNVFHLAYDIRAALAEARRVLAPGGWLVVGEGLRPFPGRPVGAELPFQLLESFTGVQLDGEIRTAPGFLTVEQWQRAFADAGFAPVELVPDVIRLRAVYPGFLAGAVCGRRP